VFLWVCIQKRVCGLLEHQEVMTNVRNDVMFTFPDFGDPKTLHKMVFGISEGVFLYSRFLK
jgi:hypothetical protein